VLGVSPEGRVKVSRPIERADVLEELDIETPFVPLYHLAALQRQVSETR
jgi:hypothetical protein